MMTPEPFYMIAQSATTDWAPVVIQGGLAGVVAVLLKWLTTTFSSEVGQLKEEQRQLKEAFNRLTKSLLLQLLAHPNLSESAKHQANEAMEELKEAEKK